MQKRHLYTIIVSLFFYPAILLAQDPQFSQFYANPIYTNPAFTGTSNNLRIVMIARDQYTALANNYRTAAASIDAKVPSLNGGLGLMAMGDVAGDGFLTTTTINGIYAYHVAVSRKVYMSAAIQASYFQRSYDFSKFKFGDQIDDRYGFINPTAEVKGKENISLPNFSTGFLVYSNQFFGGLAIANLTEPNQSFYFPNKSDDAFKMPRRYTVHAGANIYLTHQRDEESRVYISPNVMYMQQRNFNQLNLGFYVKKSNLTTGLWFRQTSKNSDAVILLVGFKFPKFRVGYSYDATISDARTATMGTHELSMAVELSIKKHSGNRRTKAIKCPQF